MPTVGRIGSLRIVIWMRDHLPPHVHVCVGNHVPTAKIAIRTGELINGRLSHVELKRVRAWLAENEVLLITAWKRFEGQEE